jgi:hypothetical protein
MHIRQESGGEKQIILRPLGQYAQINKRVFQDIDGLWVKAPVRQQHRNFEIVDLRHPLRLLMQKLAVISRVSSLFPVVDHEVNGLEKSGQEVADILRVIAHERLLVERKHGEHLWCRGRSGQTYYQEPEFRNHVVPVPPGA